MRSLAAALWVLSFSAQAASAGWMTGRIVDVCGVVHDMIARVDWQYPWQLPPRFRDHCGFEYFTARPFCSDHCGGDYQFYYCSQASFGCCHLGHGYCDWSGLLRCHPQALFHRCGLPKISSPCRFALMRYFPGSRRCRGTRV